MARKRSRYPTELELEILKVLWEESPVPVRRVREAMEARGRALAHTSLITTLNVMFKKGFVKRSKGGARGYNFAPRLSREDVSRGMVGDLVNRVFDGSAAALMVSLLKDESLDAEVYAEMRRAIERYRAEEST